VVSSDEFKKEVYQNILCPLEGNIRVFHGEHLLRELLFEYLFRGAIIPPGILSCNYSISLMVRYTVIRPVYTTTCRFSCVSS
jgi:hypothetical protein